MSEARLQRMGPYRRKYFAGPFIRGRRVEEVEVEVQKHRLNNNLCECANSIILITAKSSRNNIIMAFCLHLSLQESYQFVGQTKSAFFVSADSMQNKNKLSSRLEAYKRS